ncbi:MAG: hypothetical protein AB7U82_26105 [Blastocatellales bacterium]
MADYKPSDLLVGIVDFFAILLPGAALAFVGMKFQGKIFNGVILPALGEGAPRWIVFILSSYLIGHIVFLLGSSILDPVYGTTYRKFKSRMTGDLLFKRAGEIKRETQISNNEIENNYKWARAAVRMSNSAASAEIDRLEANSKFFRSMVVVLFIAMVILGIGDGRLPLLLNVVMILLLYCRHAYFDPNMSRVPNWLSGFVSRTIYVTKRIQSWDKTCLVAQLAVAAGLIAGAWMRGGHWITMIMCLALLLLSFWCYADQRWKMTQSAYLYFVLLKSLPPEQK